MSRDHTSGSFPSGNQTVEKRVTDKGGLVIERGGVIVQGDTTAKPPKAPLGGTGQVRPAGSMASTKQ